MSEEAREEVRPAPNRSAPMIRRVGIYGAVLLAGILIGFVPTWVRARQCAGSLAAAEQSAGLARLQGQLAAAAIDARRGDYEPARQAASQFFTSLRAEADRGEASALTPAQRGGVQPLFAERDEIITLLARNDPASADRLSDLYASYRKIVNG